MSTNERIVTREAWLDARKALLANEKAFTRERDALAAARRALPMVKVTEPYVFEEKSGKRTLADLFGGKRQLLVYHFMFAPGWEQGCKSCSFVADHFDGVLPHLAARDTAFAAISRAPIDEIEAFKGRMGWKFRWLSSNGNTFNYDFHVSFRSEIEEYNYTVGKVKLSDMPGMSAFLRDGEDVFHTYSTYARGVEAFMNTYSLLDLTPLGRHEESLPFTMAWVRHHDRYEAPL